MEVILYIILFGIFLLVFQNYQRITERLEALEKDNETLLTILNERSQIIDIDK